MSNVPSWLKTLGGTGLVRVKEAQRRPGDASVFSLSGKVVAIRKDDQLSKINGKMDVYRVEVEWLNGQTHSLLPCMREPEGVEEKTAHGQ